MAPERTKLYRAMENARTRLAGLVLLKTTVYSTVVGTPSELVLAGVSGPARGVR